MADVLAHEPRRTPWWVWAAVALAGVALVVWGVSRLGGSANPAAQSSPSPSPSSSPSPGGPVPPDPASATSACGDVEVPLVASGALPADTGIRLLVGDRDVRLVDVDAGTSRVVTTPAQLGASQVISAMTRSGGRVLAVVNGACGAGGLGNGHIVEVDATTGRLTPAGRGDEILPGTPATVLEYDAPANRWLVRRLAGGAPTPLATELPFPLAAAGSSYVLTLLGADREAPPAIGLGDAATGRLTRTFGHGGAVAASEHGVFWTAGECTPERCLLAHTGLDGVTTAPTSVRTQPCCGTVSPDGRWVAFRLPRTTGRFGSHPGPPNDVAVLDAQSGSLQVLPGLLLPAKAATTFAWSADSRWLAIGADAGTEPIVLLWHDGMQRPALVPLEPTSGGTAGAPSLVVLAPDS